MNNIFIQSAAFHTTKHPKLILRRQKGSLYKSCTYNATPSHSQRKNESTTFIRKHAPHCTQLINTNKSEKQRINIMHYDIINKCYDINNAKMGQARRLYQAITSKCINKRSQKIRQSIKMESPSSFITELPPKKSSLPIVKTGELCVSYDISKNPSYCDNNGKFYPIRFIRYPRFQICFNKERCVEQELCVSSSRCKSNEVSYGYDENSNENGLNRTANENKIDELTRTEEIPLDTYKEDPYKETIAIKESVKPTLFNNHILGKLPIILPYQFKSCRFKKVCQIKTSEKRSHQSPRGQDLSKSKLESEEPHEPLKTMIRFKMAKKHKNHPTIGITKSLDLGAILKESTRSDNKIVRFINYAFASEQRFRPIHRTKNLPTDHYMFNLNKVTYFDSLLNK